MVHWHMMQHYFSLSYTEGSLELCNNWFCSLMTCTVIVQFSLILEVGMRDSGSRQLRLILEELGERVGTSDNRWFLTADKRFLIGVIMNCNRNVWFNEIDKSSTWWPFLVKMTPDAPSSLWPIIDLILFTSFFKHIFWAYFGVFFFGHDVAPIHVVLAVSIPPLWHHVLPHLEHIPPYLKLQRPRENKSWSQGTCRPHQFKFTWATTTISRSCLGLLPKGHSMCNGTMHKLSTSLCGWRPTQRTNNVFFQTHPRTQGRKTKHSTLQGCQVSLSC